MIAGTGSTTTAPKPLTPAVLRRRKRLRLAVLAVIAAIAALEVLPVIGSVSYGCSPGQTYFNSSLEESCANSSGKTICVISAFGFTPFRRDAGHGIEYARRGPSGPWCTTAHNEPTGE